MPKTPSDDSPVDSPADNTPVPPATPYVPASNGFPEPPPPPNPYASAPPPYQAGGPIKPPTILSLLAMIFGLVGIVLVCCYGAGFLFSLAGIILGHLGLKREPTARGMAMTGVITGYVGAAGAILFVVVVFGIALSPLLFLPFAGS